jgi:hypothetical protein
LNPEERILASTLHTCRDGQPPPEIPPKRQIVGAMQRGKARQEKDCGVLLTLCEEKISEFGELKLG